VTAEHRAVGRAVERRGGTAVPDQPECWRSSTSSTWPRPAAGTAPATIIAFKSFGGEPTATFPNRACAGRVPCFSTRDRHFDAPAADIDRWPNTEPTRQLLTELANDFWPD